MAVFSMSSDGHFVRTWPTFSSVDVYVYHYTGDPYDADLIGTRDPSRWRGGGIKVGPSADSKYKALEVFGVIIQGHQLLQLYNDLTLTAPEGQQKFPLAVNRHGFCFLYINTPSVTRLRINDYFGWSKYGVKLEINGGRNVWNRCDMASGATVVDVGGEVEKKKKKEEEEEEVEWVWKKLVEEKEKQLVRFKDAMRALVELRP